MTTSDEAAGGVAVRVEADVGLSAGIRENGTVEGWPIETHYRPCMCIVSDHELQVLRVIADDGATDIETRVLFSTLIEDGWTPPPNAQLQPSGREADTSAGSEG